MQEIYVQKWYVYEKATNISSSNSIAQTADLISAKYQIAEINCRRKCNQFFRNWACIQIPRDETL